MKGGNSSLVENNAEAAKKVLSGKFAYVTDMDSVDEMVSSSHGELAKDSTTIATPGFSLATYAVKKGQSANQSGFTAEQCDCPITA